VTSIPPSGHDGSSSELPPAEPPQGELPQGDPPQGELPQGDPPQGELPQGAPPQGELPQGDPPQGELPQGELPPDEPRPAAAPPANALWPEPASSERPQPGTATAFGPRGSAGWRPWTAWAALLTGFGITVMGGVIVAIAATAMGGSASDPSAGVSLGLTFFQNFALIGAALFFATMVGRPRAQDFGLRRPRLGSAFGLLLAVWAGFFVFSGAWVTLLGLDEPQTLPDELGAKDSALNLALVIVLICVIAPIGEELFFRGYFFRALRNWKGWLPAAVITGLVFGAIHIGSAPIGYTLPLAFFGFGLCLLYERTGSLYPCIALHALNNSVAFGLTQKWSWEIAPTMVGAVIASLTIARLIARALGDRDESGAAHAGIHPAQRPDLVP